MTDTLEHTARRIADRGREELVARLRPAFQETATAHADVLELNPEQVELLVQRAADRADGLQWRRALAAVASEELGIGLGEALTHPAVSRAQTIVGAPSYEEPAAPPDTLRIAATHIGGIANLAPAEAGVELRLSTDGLDIVRGESEILGRLSWGEIGALEVPAARGWRRRRRAETHLVIRTAAGDASFEVPDLTPEQLRERLAPVIASHGF